LIKNCSRLLGGFIAAQEIIQKNENLGAKPRNKRAILGSKNPYHPLSMLKSKYFDRYF
jgi:hypothetical protein